jgi:hypothetical protein
LVDFLFESYFFYSQLSFKTKFARKDPETKKWHLVEVEAKYIKIDQNYTAHSRGGPGGARWEFWSISPQLQEAAISSFLGHLYQFLFCMKAEHLNFHFPQKYWPWAHFWPSYGV